MLRFQVKIPSPLFPGGRVAFSENLVSTQVRHRVLRAGNQRPPDPTTDVEEGGKTGDQTPILPALWVGGMSLVANSFLPYEHMSHLQFLFVRYRI